MKDPYRKKLLYRATHRGFKEADIVLGSFAAAKLPEMSGEHLAELERLLEVPDRDLYEWILKQTPVPAAFEGPVLEMLQAFQHAEAVQSWEISVSRRDA